MRLKGYHEAQLIEHFERIAEYGASTVSGFKLLCWVDQERITVNVWRTIQTYWEEWLKDAKAVGEKNVPLLIGQTDYNDYTFIWGGGLIVTKDSWFKDLKSKL